MLRVSSRLLGQLRSPLAACMATQGTCSRDLSSTAPARAPINTVTVIGSGLMGSGIAQVRVVGTHVAGIASRDCAPLLLEYWDLCRLQRRQVTVCFWWTWSRRFWTRHRPPSPPPSREWQGKHLQRIPQ